MTKCVMKTVAGFTLSLALCCSVAHSAGPSNTPTKSLCQYLGPDGRMYSAFEGEIAKQYALVRCDTPAAPPQPAPEPSQRSFSEAIARHCAEIYSKLRTAGLGDMNIDLTNNYCRQAMDVAERVDRGQLSAEIANELIEEYKRQALAASSARVEETHQQLTQQLAQYAQQQAQAQAQADAQREAARMNLITQGLRMAFPQPPPRAPMFTCRQFGPGLVTCQ